MNDIAAQSRHYRIPGGALGQFIELLWLHETPPRSHIQERMLPMATTELVIDLTSRTSGTTGLVVGPHSHYWTLDTSRASSVIGIHFKAAGAFPFFGVPAAELHNVTVPLDALWGARTASLVQRLLEARTAALKFDVLESALRCAARTRRSHPAVDFALRKLSSPLPSHRIADIAGAVGMSQRRFLERFSAEVGMAPKRYARLQRFQAVVACVQAVREVDWTDLALAYGYCDQAHLIHEFRSFSGFTPAQYLTLRGPDINHVPMPG